MRIQTLDQLLDRIAADRVWRIRELAALQGQCFAMRKSLEASRALRRAFVPVAYAHWEGFVKSTSDHYLEYVAMKGLKLRELGSGFLSVYFRHEFNIASESKKASSLAGICDRLVDRGDDVIRLRYKNVIATQSNLNSEVLEDIC